MFVLAFSRHPRDKSGASGSRDGGRDGDGGVGGKEIFGYKSSEGVQINR